MWIKILATVAIVLAPLSVIFNGGFLADKFQKAAQAPAEENPFYRLPASVFSNPFLESRESVFLPARNWNIDEPSFAAKAVLALDLEEPNKILYQKNIDQKLPIASLTKLMTALIVLEKINPDTEILISKKAIQTLGQNGQLAVGEKIKTKDLLYVMLLESSNDAAAAFEEYFTLQGMNLVSLMNEKAKHFSLANTYFFDSIGLNSRNISTARELAQLAKAALKNSLISQITSKSAFEVSSIDGRFSHNLINTNRLATIFPGLLLSKTGFSEEAGECLLMVLPSASGERVAYVILGSPDRFGEMEKLINWVSIAYLW